MMQDRIHVAFFRSSTGTMGGSHKMLLRLLQGLDEDTFEITLFSQRWDALCQELAHTAVNINIVPYPDIMDTFGRGLLDMSPFQYPVLGGRIMQYNLDLLTELGNPDVLWYSGPRTFLFTYPNQLIRRTPTILNCGLLLASTSKMKYINEFCLRSTDHVFIESERQAERQLTERQWEKYASKFTVFHKGIDVDRFDPSQYSDVADDGFTVGTAALINPRKRLEDFLEAAALVLDRDADIQFKIAGEPARDGDEEYLNQLRSLCNELGIAGQVEFVGWIEDMPRYLKHLDVFVLPSKNEGIPGAVREALAMEVPVIATDVGGIREAVSDGAHGYLVEPESPHEIAEKVIEFIEHPTKIEAFGKRGRKHIVKDFSLASYVEDYEQFLETVVDA